MKLAAYAKVNLSLDIVGRRADGYHLLRMVMQSVSLHDTVSLSDAEPGSLAVRCSRPDVPCGSGNTVIRAAKAFFRAAGIVPKQGLLFQIDKTIPSEAGLGGGSADAAAALKLLNRRFGTGLPEEELCRIGFQVGADVPFCMMGGTALVQGAGELLQSVVPLPHCWMVICRPASGCGTGEAYASFDASGLSARMYTDGLLEAIRAGDLNEIGRHIGNSFEVSCALRAVADIRDAMLCGGSLGACMTGSGSAVFGIFSDGKKAAGCCRQLSARYPFAVLCEPVDLAGL